jgi:hypothetical protein
LPLIIQRKEQIMKLADRARRIPTVAAAENAIEGVLTSERDLPITHYDSQNVQSIVAKLPTVSQHQLRMIAAYEAKHDNRVTITNRVKALTSDEPWPGYDEQTVVNITATLAGHDSESNREVGSYERAHKRRAGVHAAVKRHLEHVDNNLSAGAHQEPGESVRVGTFASREGETPMTVTSNKQIGSFADTETRAGSDTPPAGV